MVLIELVLHALIYLANFGWTSFGPEKFFFVFVFISLFSSSFLLKDNKALQEQKLVLLSAVLILSLGFTSKLAFLNTVNFLIFGGFLCWQFKHLARGKWRVFKIVTILLVVFYNQFEIYKFSVTGEGDLFLGLVAIPFFYSVYISLRSVSTQAPALYWVTTNLLLSLSIIPYLEYIGALSLNSDFNFLLLAILSILWVSIAMSDILKISDQKFYFIKLFIIFISCCGLIKVLGFERSYQVITFFGACLVVNHLAPISLKNIRLANLLVFVALTYLVTQVKFVGKEELDFFFLFTGSISISLLSMNKVKNSGSFSNFDTTSLGSILKLSAFILSTIFVMGEFY